MNWRFLYIFVCSLLLAPAFGASLIGDVKATLSGQQGAKGSGLEQNASLATSVSASASAKESTEVESSSKQNDSGTTTSSIEEKNNAAASAQASAELQASQSSSGGVAQASTGTSIAAGLNTGSSSSNALSLAANTGINTAASDNVPQDNSVSAAGIVKVNAAASDMPQKNGASLAGNIDIKTGTLSSVPQISSASAAGNVQVNTATSGNMPPKNATLLTGNVDSNSAPQMSSASAASNVKVNTATSGNMSQKNATLLTGNVSINTGTLNSAQMSSVSTPAKLTSNTAHSTTGNAGASIGTSVSSQNIATNLSGKIDVNTETSNKSPTVNTGSASGKVGVGGVTSNSMPINIAGSLIGYAGVKESSTNLRPNIGGSTTIQANSASENKLGSTQSLETGLKTNALLQGTASVSSSGSRAQSNRFPQLTNIARLLKVVEVVSNISNEAQYANTGNDFGIGASGWANSNFYQTTNVGSSSNVQPVNSKGPLENLSNVTQLLKVIETASNVNPSQNIAVPATVNNQIQTSSPTQQAFNLNGGASSNININKGGISSGGQAQSTGLTSNYQDSMLTLGGGVNVNAATSDTRPSSFGTQQYSSPSLQTGINANTNTQMNTRPTNFGSTGNQATLGVGVNVNSEMGATRPSFGTETIYSPSMQAGINVGLNSQMNTRPTNTESYSSPVNQLTLGGGLNVNSTIGNTRPSFGAQQNSAPSLQAGINAATNTQMNTRPSNFGTTGNQVTLGGGVNVNSEMGATRPSLETEKMYSPSMQAGINAGLNSQMNTRPTSFDATESLSSPSNQLTLGGGVNADVKTGTAGPSLGTQQYSSPSLQAGINVGLNYQMSARPTSANTGATGSYGSSGNQPTTGTSLNNSSSGISSRSLNALLGTVQLLDTIHFISENLTTDSSEYPSNSIQQSIESGTGGQAGTAYPMTANTIGGNSNFLQNSRPSATLNLNANGAMNQNLDQNLYTTTFNPALYNNLQGESNFNAGIGNQLNVQQSLASRPTSTWLSQQQTQPTPGSQIPSQGNQFTGNAAMNVSSSANANIRPTIQSGSSSANFAQGSSNGQPLTGNQMTTTGTTQAASRPGTTSTVFTPNAGMNVSAAAIANVRPTSQTGNNNNNLSGSSQTNQPLQTNQWVTRPTSTWNSQQQTPSTLTQGGQSAVTPNQGSQLTGSAVMNVNSAANARPTLQSELGINAFRGTNQNTQPFLTNQMTSRPTSTWTNQQQEQPQITSGSQSTVVTPSQGNQLMGNAGSGVNANSRPMLQTGLNTNNFVSGNQNAQSFTTNQMTARPQSDEPTQTNQWTTLPTSTWNSQQQRQPDTNIGGSNQNVQPLENNQWSSRPSSTWTTQNTQPGGQSSVFNPNQGNQPVGNVVLNTSAATNTNAKPTTLQTGFTANNFVENNQKAQTNQMTARPTGSSLQQQSQPSFTGGQSAVFTPTQGNQLMNNARFNASAGANANFRPTIQSGPDSNNVIGSSQNDRPLQTNQWTTQPASTWVNQQQTPSNGNQWSQLMGGAGINANSGSNINGLSQSEYDRNALGGNDQNTQFLAGQMTGRPASSWTPQSETRPSFTNPSQGNQVAGNTRFDDTTTANTNLRPSLQAGLNTNNFGGNYQNDQQLQTNQWSGGPTSVWNNQQQTSGLGSTSGQYTNFGLNQGTQYGGNDGAKGSTATSTTIRPTSQSEPNSDNLDGIGQNNQRFETNQWATRPTSNWNSQQTPSNLGVQTNLNGQSLLASQMTSRPASTWASQQQGLPSGGQSVTANQGDRLSGNAAANTNTAFNYGNVDSNDIGEQPYSSWTNQYQTQPSQTGGYQMYPQSNAQSDSGRFTNFAGSGSGYLGNQNWQQSGQPTSWVNQQQSPYSTLNGDMVANANMQPYTQLTGQQYQPSSQMAGDMNSLQYTNYAIPSDYSGSYSSNSYDKSNLKITEESREIQKSESGSNQYRSPSADGYYNLNGGSSNNYGNYFGSQAGLGGQGLGYQQYQGGGTVVNIPTSLYNSNQQFAGGSSTIGASLGSMASAGSSESRAIDKKSLRGDCIMGDSSEAGATSKASVGKCEIHESSPSTESSADSSSSPRTSTNAGVTSYSKPTPDLTSKGETETKSKVSASSGVKLNGGRTSTRRAAIEKKSEAEVSEKEEVDTKP